MKSDEKVIAEASRIEVDNKSGDVYIVFKVTDPLWKNKIKTQWVNNIEFKIKNTNLIED